MNITSIVKNNTVRFARLRHGIAYYIVCVEDRDMQFPVPLADIGDATLLADDKAIVFMRYIRQAMEDGTFVTA